MRSAYVNNRLAEIARELGVSERTIRRRFERAEKQVTPPPRAETIDRIGHLYVRKVRSEGADREATWFDVAQAYAQGWKDSEAVKK